MVSSQTPFLQHKFLKRSIIRSKNVISKDLNVLFFCLDVETGGRTYNLLLKKYYYFSRSSLVNGTKREALNLFRFSNSSTIVLLVLLIIIVENSIPALPYKIIQPSQLNCFDAKYTLFCNKRLQQQSIHRLMYSTKEYLIPVTQYKLRIEIE